MIGRVSNISFKGAYILRTPDKKTRENFEKTIGKKKQVFNDFQNEGDVLYITRSSADKRVNQFLKDTKDDGIEFRYYPNLNTKCGFDDEKYDEAVEKIEAEKDNFITCVDELPVPKVRPPKIKKEANPLPERVKSIISTLGFEGFSVKRPQTGMHYVVDDKNHVVATISPQGRFGISFVIVEPKNKDEHYKFLAMDSKGEILNEYKTPAGIKTFRSNFEKNMKYYKETSSEK